MNNRLIQNSIGLLLLLVFGFGCKNDTDIVKITPDAGPSFLDIESEGYMVELSARPVDKGQTGTWKVYIGDNGSFEDIHNPTSKFYGEPGVTYQLIWEVTEGDQYKTDLITVSYKELKPSILTEIPQDTLFHNISTYLTAAAPKYGAAGSWSILEGEGGSIEMINDSTAAFVGAKNSAYKVQWTLSFGNKIVSEELDFVTDELKAFAGNDQLDIITDLNSGEKKFYTLQAFLPAGATGDWTLLNDTNGEIYHNNLPHSLFKGDPDTEYELAWKVEIGNTVSADTVKLRFRGKWGIWVDERDNQEYRFVEINGLEWMADNYNYAEDPGNLSWYYGYGYRALIQDGHPLDNEEERKRYGRLYFIEAAMNRPPEGWRLPTAIELDDIIRLYGGELYAKEALKVGGESGLEINYPGYLSFSDISDPAFRHIFKSQEKEVMIMTSDINPSTGMGYVLTMNTSIPNVGFAILNTYFNGMSVRYVREKQ
ncbi:FISUMP domain-containing protein [Flammeovirga sp. EKP202]|uniref:FISUMP domain-containing protein n=1 Tax=Flammeovirga sp. EKP202 TaxID=2770592 RepID=UPI00165F6778|nr:FISUMP domain-containing protein [Flammeovirga sp. EKP202]MBD0402193.1 hypothetical protein [Flammeovirga sp. EKP202]